MPFRKMWSIGRREDCVRERERERETESSKKNCKVTQESKFIVLQHYKQKPHAKMTSDSHSTPVCKAIGVGESCKGENYARIPQEKRNTDLTANRPCT